MDYREFEDAYLDPETIDIKSTEEGLFYIQNAFDGLPGELKGLATRLLIIAQDVMKAGSDGKKDWMLGPDWGKASLAAVACGVAIGIAAGTVKPDEEIPCQDAPVLIRILDPDAKAEDMARDLIKMLRPDAAKETEPKQNTPNMN